MNPLTITGLRKRFDEFELRADIALPRGHVTGLVGANGSGKTTLIKCALGAVIPDSGEIELIDKTKVGVVHDTPPYAPTWTVAATGRIVGAFFPTWDQAAFDAHCRRWELPATTKVGRLSRGMGMRLQMAIALAHDPELLILDEPTSGLDPLARDELVDDLRELMLDERRTILFSTHITSDLEKIADFVTVLDAGRVLEAGTLDALRDRYRIVRGGDEPPAGVRGVRRTAVGWDGLAERALAESLPGAVVDAPTLEDVVIRLAKDGRTTRKEHTHA
ncbi:ABC transporter ATP-binding protein [uncultured Tessaracoccus sp.]|uniref:ABC transporter ATP-binding protein n=1 Tax=uncultured Tessaracoccus sp. TaxID=905023 RepID=UPI0025F3A41C|nr:ABC transporter ATP-binding protein [uncultured Tessaracoccus sp.]